MIAGNVWIDEQYSAVTINQSNQKYHFDRQNYIAGSTGDTRGEVAAEWLSQACNCFQNSAAEAKYIGRAMHSMQDASSHGDIGINHSWAAHDVAGHADNRAYVWKDSSRGANAPRFSSGVTKTTKTQLRWDEALEFSAATLLLYAILRTLS